jgi:hypothetical protein
VTPAAAYLRNDMALLSEKQDEDDVPAADFEQRSNSSSDLENHHISAQDESYQLAHIDPEE